MGNKPIFKAQVIGSSITIPEDPGASRRMPEDPFEAQYGDEIIAPPFDMRALAILPETSSILPQCIEAMETNVDGFGWNIVPKPGVKPGDDGKFPPEVEAERGRLVKFFDFANPEISYTQIRRRTRRDLEATGNAYWEILRDGKGDICGIEHIESHTMRLTRLDREITETEVFAPTEAFTLEKIVYRKRFRRFVQIRDGVKVWFKEFGDPRTFNALTGKVATEDDQRKTGFVSATEVLHFRIYSSRTPYGVPRWIGTTLSVRGSRQAEEVNHDYFENKTVPPLALLVGGTLAEGSVETIKDYVESNMKGRANFHKILVIEADVSSFSAGIPGTGGPAPTLKFENLTGAQQKDALFVEYDSASRKKVRSAFRLPPLYVGESDDYTRATAAEAKAVAEEQVFGPERDDHDFIVNRRILSALGVRFWEYKSLTPKTDDPVQRTTMLDTFVRAGMTVREARAQIAEILNIDLTEPEGAEWLDMPLSVYLEKIRLGAQLVEGENAQTEAVEKFTSLLVGTRERLEDRENRIE